MPSPEELFSLAGQVAVVTGAGSGLGRALATGLARSGARVLAWDIDSTAAEACVAEIEQSGGFARAVRCDVTNQEEVEAALQDGHAELGDIHVLVTSAGIGMRSPATSMTPDQWSRVLDVNLTGSWNCAQAVGRSMVEREIPGRIVTVASVAALVGLTTGNANYAASKGGVIALMRTLAMEWAPFGIRVNAIAPTHFRTPLIEKAIADHPETLEYFLGNIPLGRLGEPDEIVGPGLFLASQASSMVTGHVLVVDGGHTAR